jgi:hypothetical protein
MLRTAARGRLFASVAATAAMAFVAAISVPVSSSGAAVSTSALPTIAGLNLGKTEPTTLGGNFPLKSKPPTGKTICYVNNGNPYAQLYLAGMNQAAPALGWTVKVVTANEAQPSTYGTAILSSIQAGCNAVIEAGANLPYWRAEIPTAQKAHVIIEDALTSDTAANNLPGVIRAQKSEFAQYYQGVVTGMGFLRSIRQYYPKGNAGVMMMLISQFKSTEQPLNNGVAAAIHAGCPSCKVSTADFDLSAVLGPNSDNPGATSSPWNGLSRASRRLLRGSAAGVPSGRSQPHTPRRWNGPAGTSGAGLEVVQSAGDRLDRTAVRS